MEKVKNFSFDVINSDFFHFHFFPTLVGQHFRFLKCCSFSNMCCMCMRMKDNAQREYEQVGIIIHQRGVLKRLVREIFNYLDQKYRTEQGNLGR